MKAPVSIGKKQSFILPEYFCVVRYGHLFLGYSYYSPKHFRNKCSYFYRIFFHIVFYPFAEYIPVEVIIIPDPYIRAVSSGSKSGMSDFNLGINSLDKSMKNEYFALLFKIVLKKSEFFSM